MKLNITDVTENGKTYATVTERDGGAEVYRTASYTTVRMAVADACCWVAFNYPTEEMTLGCIKAYREGIKARAKMTWQNTVTVSTGTHELPWDMALALLGRDPHPHTVMAGSMGKRMLARQALFTEAAELLGISRREARELPRLLRANR